MSDCRSRGREFDPGGSHTFIFMEIDHEIISTVILLPSAYSLKKGFCQLQAKVCVRSTGYRKIEYFRVAKFSSFCLKNMRIIIRGF